MAVGRDAGGARGGLYCGDPFDPHCNNRHNRHYAVFGPCFIWEFYGDDLRNGARRGGAGGGVGCVSRAVVTLFIVLSAATCPGTGAERRRYRDKLLLKGTTMLQRRATHNPRTCGPPEDQTTFRVSGGLLERKPP